MGLLLGGMLLWPVAIVLPISVAMILYGVIPLGSPAEDFTLSGQWPMIVFVIPSVMTLVSFLTIRIYSAVKGDLQRRMAIPTPYLMGILLTTYLSEVLCLGLITSMKGNIDLLGLVALGVCYLVTFPALFLSEQTKHGSYSNLPLYETTTPTSPQLQQQQPQQPQQQKNILLAYLKVALVVFIHFLWLIAFIIGYREARWIAAVQPLLNFGMAIVVFIFKKILLHITDPFPLEPAMLISALWIQNLSDIFQALAYPSIVNPITYAYIWLIHLLANLAYLLFLTDSWFRFRVWIKGVLKCRCGNMPSPEEEDDPYDHGHSWNHPAYIRRQLRFFFWRVFSGVWAIIFYVCLSGILRLGPNSRYYPFSSNPYLLPGDSDNRNIFAITWTDYGNSLVFVAVDSGALLLAGLLGYLYALKKFPDNLRKILFWKTFDDPEEGVEGAPTDNPMRRVANESGREEGIHPTDETAAKATTRGTVYRYIELVLSVLMYNALVSVMILQYHMKIWWAFESERAETDHTA